MNKTKIEWCDSTWNPITGCLHDCKYCYAKRIAERFGKKLPDHSGYPQRHNGCHMLDNAIDGNPYPSGFEPTFHAYRLDEPKRKAKPRTIFVCSMSDMFGGWVPDGWIEEVFKACEAAPQHRYLFLTKNPSRYMRISKSLCDYQNMWFGTSATETESFNENGMELTALSRVTNNFMSIEPLLEEIDPRYLPNIKYLNWVIIGAETGYRKDKVIPKREWIEKIVEQSDRANVPVFMKDSLKPIMGEENMRRELPWT